MATGDNGLVGVQIKMDAEIKDVLYHAFSRIEGEVARLGAAYLPTAEVLASLGELKRTVIEDDEPLATCENCEALIWCGSSDGAASDDNGCWLCAECLKGEQADGETHPMTPTVHLDECPEPAAYWPNDMLLVVYTVTSPSHPFQTLLSEWAAVVTAGFVTRREPGLPSASYRMF